MEPINGDQRLVMRLFLFPCTLFGVKKWGFQKVYQEFRKDYVNYEDADFQCWFHHCWEDQPERII